MAAFLRQILPDARRAMRLVLCLSLIAAAAQAQALPPVAGFTNPGACPSCDWLSLDGLDGRPAFGDWTYSIGGEVRYRHFDEHNRLRPNGTTHSNYDQWRFAPYLELKNDWLSAYVQGIDASSFNSEIAPIPPDVNRADLLQYYIDAQLWESDAGAWHVRAGRQFLKYGSQYLISPLPWANSYRNFEGVRTYWQSELWDIDAFAVRPVNGAAVPSQWRPTSRDLPDSSVWFSGVYVSRKKVAGGALDGYWLWNREYQPLASRQDGNRHTLALRYWGSRPLGLPVAATGLWDVEGGWQVGDDNFGPPQRVDVSAGFASAIGAVTLNDVPWSPTFKGLFWYGSGDHDPADGTVSTFTTLYSFVHSYWGILDNLNGSNLVQYSAQFSVKPTSQLTLHSQWHWFDKAATQDAIYNAPGTAFGGASARHIGEELDLFGSYMLSADLELQLGYSWFWYGPAVGGQPAIRRGDAHQAYVMTTWTF